MVGSVLAGQDMGACGGCWHRPQKAGDVVINLGGDSNQDNHLEIYPGWNATFRIYNPKPACFDGSWIRPELELK